MQTMTLAETHITRRRCCLRRRKLILQSVPSVSLLLLLLLLASFHGASSSPSSPPFGTPNTSRLDPYKVLDVPSSADQDEIRKSYRKLCLRYHPDKNVDGTDAERRKCEEAFKNVQRANELIGDEESRRRYDQMARFGGHRYGSAGAGHGGHGYGGGSPYGAWGTSSYNDLFRSFSGQPFYHHQRGAAPRRTAFYFNGIDISDWFSGRGRGGIPPFPYGSPPSAASYNNNAPRSIFVQKVTVPLEQLYTGVSNKVFQLHDTPLQRYRAAFRGGLARQLAVQSLPVSIGLLFRTSLPVSVAVFCLMFHLSLPHPTRLSYPVNIGRGWKGGTKVSFNSSEPGMDVVFVIQEGRHDRFVRSGDDLCTTVTIGERMARRGCTVRIDPLGGGGGGEESSSAEEVPIVVRLKPGEIARDGQVRRVVGRGWPRRKLGGRGDLLVEFRLASSDSGTPTMDDNDEEEGGDGAAPSVNGGGGGRRKKKKKRRTAKI